MEQELLKKLILYKLNIPAEDALLSEGVRAGWQGNLWHCYLASCLVLDENPFSLACERRIVAKDSLWELAKSDLEVFAELFKHKTEQELLMDFHHLSNASKTSAANRINTLAVELGNAKSTDEMVTIISEYYEKHGVGVFGQNHAFRVAENGELIAHEEGRSVSLDDLVGYETQKAQLIENTKTFVEGRHTNNVLLYGDAGTGKSTSVQAIVNQFSGDGLRLIELYKHQFKEIPQILSMIKNRNYRFILLLDDLSFEENEIEYKYLKAVMEGGAEASPDNVLIYATSNRRHLIKETWNDRSDMQHNGDIHRSDTMEEKLSLAGRFGLQLYYPNPTYDEYLNIVEELAKTEPGLAVYPDDKLKQLAKTWQVRHGSRSGRTAQQFINDLLCHTTESEEL